MGSKLLCDSIGRRKKVQPRTKEDWLAAIQHDKLSLSGILYDYSKVKGPYVKSSDRITFVCSDHGPSTVYAASHLKCKCSACAMMLAGKAKAGKPSKRKLSLEAALAKAKSIFPDLDYSKVTKYDPTSKWSLICPKHGEYKHSVLRLLWGPSRGCAGCRSDRLQIVGQDKSDTSKDVFDAAIASLNYKVIKYTRSQDPAILECPDHGKFSVNKAYYISQDGICPECRKGGSIAEKKLQTRLLTDGLVKHVQLHRRDLILNQELDVYLPEHKLAIEVNGIWWHNDSRKDKNYHVNKTKATTALGIQLLHFTDLDIHHKLDLVVSMIYAKCGLFKKRGGARKTVVDKDVSYSEAASFLKTSHIQGPLSGQCYIGLRSTRGTLLCLAVFGKPRFNKTADWELLRFATLPRVQVIGGLTRLLSAFASDYTGVLISYADLSYSQGNAYEVLGFTRIRSTSPSYTWHRGNETYSRYQTQKSKLENLLDDFDADLSEAENMKANKFWRLYNCGSLLYSISLDKLK